MMDAHDGMNIRIQGFHFEYKDGDQILCMIFSGRTSFLLGQLLLVIKGCNSIAASSQKDLNYQARCLSGRGWEQQDADAVSLLAS